MKFIQALLVAVTATYVVGKPRVVKTPHVRDTEDDCQRLQQAGLALYDEVIEKIPRFAIEDIQDMSPVDLLDREDVADFLCTVAGVECIEDLALLLNMPEPMVRQFYYTMHIQMRQQYRPAPGQNLVQEIFHVWDILMDIVKFAEQVGYSGPNPYGGVPDYMAENDVPYMYGDHGEVVAENQQQQAHGGVEQNGQQEQSGGAYPGENEINVGQDGQYEQYGQYGQGGAEPQVNVDWSVALDFAERMEEKHGKDWENVLAGAITRNGDMSHDHIDVDMDPATLAAAIAFSSDEMEFATNIELPQMIIMYLVQIIYGLQTAITPAGDLTIADVYSKMLNVAKVAFDLGLFALN